MSNITALASIKDAAKLLNVSTKTLRRWEARGLLVPVRTDGGHRRYEIEKIKELKGNKRHTRISQTFQQAPVAIVPQQQITVPVLYEGLHIDQKRILKVISGFALFSLIAFAIVKITTVNAFDSIKNKIFGGNLAKNSQETSTNSSLEGTVLAATTSNATPKFNINIESAFKDNSLFTKDVEIDGDLTLKKQIIGNVDLTGVVIVGGNSITTSQNTFNLINTTANTLNIGGAATTLSLGATTGNTNVNNNLNVKGNSTITGTQTVTGKITGSGDLAISGTTALGGAETVAGKITGSGDLDISGDATFGDITEINGVTYSFPDSQGGAATLLTNDGSGNLTWTNPSIGGLSGVLSIANGGTSNSTAYTSGSVIFSDGTSLTQDNSNFFWDNSGKQLGIGNAAPGSTLDVTGTGRFSGSLTASNGFTLTTGVLDLTSTSGTSNLTSTATSGDSFAFTNNSLSASNSNLLNLTFKNANTGAGTIANGLTINATGSTPSSLTNAENLINLGATALGSNTFTGINFGSGLSNYISSTNWTVTAAGAETIASDLGVNGGNITTSQTTANIFTGATTLGIGNAAGTTTINGILAVSGASNLNGNTTIGDATTDIITFNGRVAQDSDLLPIGTTGVNDLGSASLPWDNVYATNFIQNGFNVCDASGANCPSGSVSFWDQSSGVLYPNNNSVDVLIGSNSTASAKISFTGINGGLPVASIAGNISNVATYLNGNGNLSTTNAGDLTLGSSTTGNVVLNSRGSAALTANGSNLTATGTFSLPNSNSLTGVSNYLQASQGYSVGGNTTYFFDGSGNLNASSGTFAGNLSANGDSTFGNAITDAITFTGRVAADSDLLPIGTTGVNDIGSSTLPWDNVYAVAFTQNGNTVCDSSGNCPTGAQYWKLANGTISPFSDTLDVTIGASATTSAKFAFTGVNSGTPTASIAGSTANVATYLTGNGNLAVTNGAHLTLGGNTTGQVDVNNNLNVSTSNGYLINNTSVLNSTTLGSSVVNSSLTQVGALASGSIANGFGTIATANTITGTTLNGTTGINTGAVAGTQRIDSTGNLVNIANISASGYATISGSVALGNTTATAGPGNLDASGRITGVSIYQGANQVCDTSGNCPTGAQYWKLVNGTLSPFSDTLDITIGASATTSAKFAFTGVSSGIPTASVAGTTANVATYLNGEGNISTTNMAGLTLGSSTTGNVVINSRGNTALTANGANLTTTGTVTLPNSNTLTGVANYLQNSQGFSVGGGTTYYFDASGNINANAGTFAGALTANGDVTFGNAITDAITFTGRVAADSDLLPIGTTGTNDLGSALLPWDNVYANNFVQNGFSVCDSSGANCPTAGSGGSKWSLGNGVISPFVSSLDVLFGGTSTSSAKFAFINNASGLPTASISGDISNVATYLTGNGALSTTNARDLTLGSSTTGNVVINSRGNSALTANGANLTTTGTVTLPNTNTLTGVANYLQNSQGFSVGGGTTYYFDASGNINANAGTFAGALTANGDATLGNAITDNITFTGRVATDSDLLPIGTTGTNDLGSALLPWDNVYGVAFTQNGNSVCDASGANCPAAGSGGSKWSLGNGVISPFSSTLDVLIGGTSTASAKFAFTGVNSGIPTASISGTYLTSDGTLATTNNQHLTLGGNTTGQIDANNNLNVSTGNGYLINNASVLNSTTLGSSVVNSSLTQVGALASGSIANGFGTIATANTITGTTLNGTTGINTGAVAGTQRIDSTGNLVNIANISASGYATISGSVALGNTTATAGPGNLDASGRITGVSIYQGANQVCDTSGNCSAVGNYFGQANGALYPVNNSVDFLIGANATTSAKFAFTGVASGTPTASISGTYLTSTGTLSNTSMKDLTLGSSTTGNVILNSRGSSALTANGTSLTAGGTFTLPNTNILSGVANYVQSSTGYAVGGATTYHFDSSGNLVANDVAVNSGNLTTTQTTANVFTNATTLGLGAGSGTTTVNNGLAITGSLTANGDVTLGNAITDAITFTGRVATDSDLLPIGTTGTNDLGSALLPWDNVYAVSLSQNGNSVCDSSGNCAGVSSMWQLNNKVISPAISSYDLAIGGISTASAQARIQSDGSIFVTPTSALTTAIDLTDTDLTNALNIGDNNIIGTTAAIDFTNFDVATTGVITLANGETIDNTTNGSINIGATTLELTGGNTIHSNQTSFDLLNTTTTTLNIGNAATTLSLGATTGTSTVRNALTVNGDATLGDAITDNITFTGRVATDSDLLPIGTSGTNDLGSALLPWDNVYAVAFTQNGNSVCDTSGNCSTVGNQWQLNNKVVSPAISSYDLAIGGTATGSAFQIFGIEQTTGDIAKLNSTVITSGNVFEATASAITSGNLIKLGSGGNNGNFTGNAIFADLDNTGGSSFTGNFLKFDNATSTKFTVNSGGNIGVAAGSGIDTITAGALALGTGTASSVSISKSGVTTTVNGGLTSTETLTASNGLTLTTGALSLTSTSGTSSLTSTATSGDSFAFTNNSINTASGNLANFTFKNNNTGGAGVAVSGVNISATGSTPISGTNTENLINLSATALGSNTFNGINFGNGLTNYINGTNFSVTSAGAVTALGGLSASGGTVALNSTGTSSTTIGNTTGTTTFTGNILPGTTNTSSLGSSSSLQFATIYANVFTQNGNNVCDSAGNNCPTGTSGGSKWKLANGAVSPFSDSLDVLIGSSATTSAKFAFTGVASGTPTASISGTTANVATYLNGNGNLSTTNMAALTLGSSTTGNVVINSRGSAALTANGIDLTAGGDLAVNGATSADITTTTTTATLFDTTATTLSLGGAATTALNIGNGTGAYTAINLGSGSGTHTINIAGTGATSADIINIGTGGTGADTINIGSNASTTALNLTSGTGSQTHLSSVATGTGLSAAFVFKDTALSSGDLIYATASAITSGDMLHLGQGGNTNFTGNGIHLDFNNTGQGGIGFTGNFLKFENATVNKFLVTSAGNIDSAGTASISGSLTFKTGASSIQTTASSALTIGGATTGNITLNPLNAVAGGFVAPNTTNVTDLGTASLLWRNIYGTTIAGTTLTQGGNAVCDSSGANCPAGASIWGQALGVIYPLNNSEDLLIGSSATTSAKFAFTGVKSGTPTASISGTTANVATYLNGNGNLSTTNMANLTLGSATTGDVTINSRGSTALTASGANTLLNGIIYFANSSYYVDGSGNANLNAGTFAANISANSGTITTTQTTGNLFDTTATTLNLGGAATTALNLGNGTGNYSAINLGSGVGTHTINIAGTGATAADTINIGTGGTGADTINIGSNASTTALNLTSGTGAQTFASSVVSGTGTSGAFAFTANALTTGTGMYLSSSAITTGDLLQINATGTTLTTGFLLDVQNNSSSVFTVGASQITAALPTQFTAAGDVNIAYDLIFTNQTASTIDSYGPLTVRAGESFESNNLTFKTYNSGNVVFDQDVNGKVLIGTGSATLKFTVSDSQAATAAAMIENTYNGNNADGLAIKLGYTGNGATSNRFISFLNGVGNTVGRVEATTGLGVAYQTSGIDFAEYFTKDTSINFEEGDIVSLSNSNAIKSGSESDSAMIGIVSASPGFKGGNEGADKVLVGLVGQVPLKISPSSSPIKVGDLITSSNDTGRGKKATGAGFIIGKALEAWNGQDKIMVYVSPTYADPNMSLTASGNLKLEQDTNNPGYTKLTDGQGNTVNMLSGLTSLLTNTFNAFQGTVDNLLVKVGLISPSVLTNTISPLPGEKDINIQVGSATESGKLAIKNAADQIVAGVDSSGNATFSGSLHAGTIYADQIISRDAKFGDTSTNTLGGISRQEIEDLLTSVESDINMLNQSQNWSVNTATSSSSLNELNLKDLFVTGTAAMNSLSLSESLTLGTDMVISSALNSIDTLNNPLLIQASASQPLYIMAGKVQIDTTGNMQVLGNLAVGGVLSASAVNIAEDPNATTSALLNVTYLDSLASAGQAQISSGSAEITLRNPNIKSNSLIFVTPTSEVNENLYVKSEASGSAVIGFKSNANNDVKFNWWIVNQVNGSN